MLNGVASSMFLVPAIGTPGAQLRLGSASRWRTVVETVQARYGWTPKVTGPLDAFRPLSGNYYAQTETFLRRYTTIPTQYAPGRTDRRVWQGRAYYRKACQSAASVPGTSNHGEGRTVDVESLGGFDGVRYRQFAAVATEVGFSNIEGRRIDEYWHWNDILDPDVPTVVNAPPTTIPAPQEEDDMTPDQEKKIDTLLGQGEALLALLRVPGQPFGYPQAISNKVDAVEPQTRETRDRVRGAAPEGDVLQIILARVNALGGGGSSLSDADVARIVKAVIAEIAS